MADRHQRGNKEARKPKKVKAAEPAAPILGSQVKLAGAGKQSAGNK